MKINLLSTEQREQFIRDGYVAVSGLIPGEIVRSTRDSICAAMQVSLTDSTTWPSVSHDLGMDCVEKTLLCRTAAMDDAAQELLGPQLWRDMCISSVLDQQGKPPYIKGFIPVLAYPRAGEKRFDPTTHNKAGYHVDGIHFVSLYPKKILLVALAYLTDTTEYGGATAVVPGSHRQVFEHWQARGELPTPENILEGLEFAPPITVPGKAGDVIFMHHLMVHSGSANHDDHVRVAINANFTSQLDQKYLLKTGAPQSDWTPLDWTLRTDNLAS